MKRTLKSPYPRGKVFDNKDRKGESDHDTKCFTQTSQCLTLHDLPIVTICAFLIARFDLLVSHLFLAITVFNGLEEIAQCFTEISGRLMLHLLSHFKFTSSEAINQVPLVVMLGNC